MLIVATSCYDVHHCSLLIWSSLLQPPGLVFIIATPFFDVHCCNLLLSCLLLQPPGFMFIIQLPSLMIIIYVTVFMSIFATSFLMFTISTSCFVTTYCFDVHYCNLLLWCLLLQPPYLMFIIAVILVSLTTRATPKKKKSRGNEKSWRNVENSKAPGKAKTR